MTKLTHITLAKAVLLLLTCWTPDSLLGQIVSNGNIEAFGLCQNNLTATTGISNSTCVDWSAATRGTSDYFNSCINVFPNFFGTPFNAFGYQVPHSGDAYLGLFLYHDKPHPVGALEYIENKLTTTLTNGTEYLVELEISLGDDSQFYVDSFPCFFSNTLINTGGGAQLTNTPDIVFIGTFNDTTNWTHLSATYTANGTENYLLFGATTPHLSIGLTATGVGSKNGAYYYVDDVSITEIIPLPVKTTAFTIACNDHSPTLTWTTASEINNAYFTIERSTDAPNFEAMATVNGNGNSTTTINYSWTDDHPINGKTYYRLKQTDFNGHSENHGIRSMVCEKIGDIKIYPNPFESSFTVQLAKNTTYPITVEIMDYLGRKVYYETINNRSTEIVLDHQLSDGTYFVKVYNASTQLVERIVKMK